MPPPDEVELAKVESDTFVDGLAKLLTDSETERYRNRGRATLRRLNRYEPADAGLNGKSGIFAAVAWTETEKEQNSVRRGFIQPTPTGHALQHADGTPFFMVGDTWLAGSTWRLPFRNTRPVDDYVPGPGIGFEDAVAYRKSQGGICETSCCLKAAGIRYCSRLVTIFTHPKLRTRHLMD